MNIYKQKISLIAILSVLTFSTSGCIGSFIAGPIGGLAVTGSAFMALSLSCGYLVTEENPTKKINNILKLCVIGMALDEKNPGRVSALNELPMDEKVSSVLGVTLVDLENYNDELNQVIRVNTSIEKALNDFKSLGLSFSSETMNRVAVANGFNSGHELETVFKSDALSQIQLQKFALANGLTEKTAAIYLKSRFGIKVE